MKATTLARIECVSSRMCVTVHRSLLSFWCNVIANKPLLTAYIAGEKSFRLSAVTEREGDCIVYI